MRDNFILLFLIKEGGYFTGPRGPEEGREEPDSVSRDQGGNTLRGLLLASLSLSLSHTHTHTLSLSLTLGMITRLGGRLPR